MTEHSEDTVDVLPPQGEQQGATSINNYLALVDSYTDRPDLLIAEIEKHDPGFIKRMNSDSEAFSRKEREARFKFGKYQAYLATTITAAVALVTAVAVIVAIFKEAGVGTFIGLAIFYAIAQGGTVGFSKIIDAVTGWIRGHRSAEEKE